MAGFMSGFGPAFANSFQKARDNRREDEKEIFKLKYNEYLQNKESYTSTLKEQTKAAKQAETLAKEAGDPGAYNFIYNRILTVGLDDTMRQIRDGRLTKDEGYVPQRSSNELPNSAVQNTEEAFREMPSNISRKGATRINEKLNEATGGNYEEVMSKAGLNDQQSIETYGYNFATPEKGIEKLPPLEDLIYARDVAKQQGNGALTAKFDMQINAIKAAKTMDAVARGKEQGIQYQYVRTNDGYTYAQVVQDPDTGEVKYALGDRKVLVSQGEVQPASEDEVKAFQDAYAKAAKPLENYYNKAGAVVEGLNIVGRTVDIVRSDPRILTVAAAAADTLTTGVREVVTGVDLLKEQFEEGDVITEESLNKVLEYEDQLNRLVSSGIQDVAEKRAVFNSLIQLASYKFAAMAGQDGRAASDTDIQRFLEIAGSSNKVETFETNMRNAIQIAADGVRGERAVLTDRIPEVQGFEKTYGREFNLGSKSLEELVQRSNSRFVQSGWNFVQEESPLHSGGSPTPASSSTVIPKGAIDYLKSNSSNQEVLDAFREKYGVDPKRFLDIQNKSNQIPTGE